MLQEVVAVTPHQVLSLLTQDQTEDVMLACCQYLPVDRVERALRRGLEPLERRQLAYQLSIEFDSSDTDNGEES